MSEKGVWQLLRKKYGRLVYPETRTVFLPQNVVTRITEEDPERVQMVIVNNSDFPIYVNFFPQVTEVEGIRIQEKGGILTLFFEEDGILPTYAVYGLSPFGNSTVYVIEIKLGI